MRMRSLCHLLSFVIFFHCEPGSFPANHVGLCVKQNLVIISNKTVTTVLLMTALLEVIDLTKLFAA